MIWYMMYILYDSSPQEDPKYWILLNGRLPPGWWMTLGGFFKKKTKNGKSSLMGLSENVVYPEKPHGFADHYPVMKNG